MEIKKIEGKDAATLFTLTTHMEMDQGESHKWVIAYEADPHLRVVLELLHQGQRKDDYVLIPSGLIGIKKHGQTKSVVPSFLC